jgi:hypothetical protein
MVPNARRAWACSSELLGTIEFLSARAGDDDGAPGEDGLKTCPGTRVQTVKCWSDHAVDAALATQLERRCLPEFGAHGVAADLAYVVGALVKALHGPRGALQIGLDLVEERQPLSVGFRRHAPIVLTMP